MRKRDVGVRIMLVYWGFSTLPWVLWIFVSLMCPCAVAGIYMGWTLTAQWQKVFLRRTCRYWIFEFETPWAKKNPLLCLILFKVFHVDLSIYKGPKPLKPKLKPSSTQRSQNVSKVGTRRWTLSVLQNWMRLKWKSLRNVSPEGFSASKLGKFREILWRFARKRWSEVDE